jgi:cell wall-associated NlpC family hydrolase
MPVTRTAVVDAARKWIDTPFAHQGRVRGRAVDCLGLVLCVLEEVGAMGASSTSESWTRLPEYTQYGREPGKGKVYAGCVKHAKLKPFSEAKPGDILSLRAPSEPCHVAFVSSKQGDTLYIIHAYNGGKKACVEHILDKLWLQRVAGVFEIPGIEE